MRQPSFLVLAALAGGCQHGYGLMQSIRAGVEGGGGIQAGTLYAALDRLADEGLVRVAGEETDRLDRRVRWAQEGLAGRRRAAGATGPTRSTGAAGAARSAGGVGWGGATT